MYQSVTLFVLIFYIIFVLLSYSACVKLTQKIGPFRTRECIKFNTNFLNVESNLKEKKLI